MHLHCHEKLHEVAPAVNYVALFGHGLALVYLFGSAVDLAVLPGLKLFAGRKEVLGTVLGRGPVRMASTIRTFQMLYFSACLLRRRLPCALKRPRGMTGRAAWARAVPAMAGSSKETISWGNTSFWGHPHQTYAGAVIVDRSAKIYKRGTHPFSIKGVRTPFIKKRCRRKDRKKLRRMRKLLKIHRSTFHFQATHW